MSRTVLAVHRENYPCVFSLDNNVYEAIIVAEDMKSAKEILFQACFFGKGSHDQCSGGGDGHFPNILDYYYGLEERLQRWGDDCREIFFDEGSAIGYVWDNEDGCLMETEFEVSDIIKSGIYLKVDQIEDNMIQFINDVDCDPTNMVKSQFEYWDYGQSEK